MKNKKKSMWEMNATELDEEIELTVKIGVASFKRFLITGDPIWLKDVGEARFWVQFLKALKDGLN